MALKLFYPCTRNVLKTLPTKAETHNIRHKPGASNTDLYETPKLSPYSGVLNEVL